MRWHLRNSSFRQLICLITMLAVLVAGIASAGFLAAPHLAPPLTVTPRCSAAVLNAPPSPPPTVDLRKKRPEDPNKYGVDPRDNVEDALVADTTWLSKKVKPGNVNVLTDVSQLAAALDGEKQFVVLKFKRVGCAACASTQDSFKKLAKDLKGNGLFFEVDFDDARPFCRLCKIRFVPAAHIYSNGAFVGAKPIGKNSWDGFMEAMNELQGKD